MPRSRARTERRTEASRLRTLRDVMGLTQRELAAELHVAHGAVAGWESGARTLPGPVLRLIELYERELGLGSVPPPERPPLARRGRTMGTALLRTMADLAELLAQDANDLRSIRAHARAAVARHAVELMGELRGLAAKLGQTLALADYGLPQELRDELANLSACTPPMSAASVVRVFLDDHGCTPREIFAEWSPTPFATASLGQVHRARLLSGEHVAVKVQYPRIAQSIESDLAAAAPIERLLRRVFRGQPHNLLDELRARFAEECDYRVEARHQEDFIARWTGRRGIRIPRVFAERSSERVLVTELVDGLSFDAFCAQSSSEQRNRAGASIWRFAQESFLVHGVIHADPHPGNYLFSGDDVVVLDFGCVKRFTAAQLAWALEAHRAYLAGDADAARRLEIEGGFVPDPRDFDFDHHYRMTAKLYEPMRAGRFRFSTAFAEETWRMRTRQNPNRFRASLPPEWLFWNRLQLGLHSVLARLGAEADFGHAMREILRVADARRAGRGRTANDMDE